MQETAFKDVVDQICVKDNRYDPDAYIFVRSVLDFTITLFKKPSKGPERHVSGLELLEGIRQYALEEFGPMSLTVFTAWGISKTEDFGEIVFNLVEAGVLGRTEKDNKDDFADGYDLRAAFSKPFLPGKTRKRKGRGKPRATKKQLN